MQPVLCFVSICVTSTMDTVATNLHQFAVELEGIKDDRQYCTLHIAAKLFFSTTPPSRSVKCGSQTFLKERDVAFSWSVNRLPGSPAMNGIYGSLLY